MSVRQLGSSSAATHWEDIDVDWATLCGGVLVVEVVEGTAQALLEDSVWAKNKGVVGADSPAGVVDGTSLDWVVELELPVGGDVTNASLGVLEDTVLEGEHQSDTLLQVALGRGDIDNLNLENTVVRSGTAGSSSGGWGSGSSRSSGHEGEGGERVTHYGDCRVVINMVVVYVQRSNWQQSASVESIDAWSESESMWKNRPESRVER